MKWLRVVNSLRPGRFPTVAPRLRSARTVLSAVALCALVATASSRAAALTDGPSNPSELSGTPSVTGAPGEAEQRSAAELAETTSPSPISGQLAVPSEQALESGEQQRAATEAQRNTPEAVARRHESETKFKNQSSGQADQTDSVTFPAVINESQGGPPKLAHGQNVVGYEDGTVAQVDLGGGRGALIESTTPMAFESSPKHWTATNLQLHNAQDGFEPTAPWCLYDCPSASPMVLSSLRPASRSPRSTPTAPRCKEAKVYRTA